MKKGKTNEEEGYLIDYFSCVCCGKTKDVKEFYKSRDFLYKANGILPFCKQCIIDLYEDLLNKCHKNDKMAIYTLCRMLNLYFNENLFLAVQTQAANMGSPIIQIYFQKINSMTQYKGKTFDDSNYLDGKDDVKIAYFVEDVSEFVVSAEMVRRWGKNLSVDDYETLEYHYQEFITAYESKTPTQRNIYIDIARTRLEAKKCLDKGRITEYEKMMSTVSKLMNDGNIKPVQENGADVDGLSTWGQWVRKIEETEPIPEPTDEFKDVDRITKYVTNWFTKQFYKILGNDVDDVDLSLEEEIEIDESFVDDEEDEEETVENTKPDKPKDNPKKSKRG